MRTTLILLGTFLLVYFLTPWLAHELLQRTVEHPERYAAAAWLAVWAVYALLRAVFQDKLPHV